MPVGVGVGGTGAPARTLLTCRPPIAQEHDSASMRNAFLMLLHAARDRAVQFLAEHLDQISKFGIGMQHLVLELIRKVRRAIARAAGRPPRPTAPAPSPP